jgi:hypothetical protein
MPSFGDISIPSIGWIVILGGILLVVVAPRWLYLLSIGAVTFSATSVINFGAPNSDPRLGAFGLQAAILLGSLWMVRESLGLLKTRRLAVPLPLRRPVLLLGAFVAAGVASLIMPVLINGRFLVREPEAGQSFIPLSLETRHLSQTLYLVYGSAFAVAVAIRSLDRQWRRSTIQAYVAGGAALALWGWVQLIILLIGLPYPRSVFNTNVHPGTQGSELVLDLPIGTVHRLSSAAVEPSIFAQTLLTIIPLLAIVSLRGFVIFSRAWDITLLVGMTTILLLSTATTAYVGLLVLAALTLFSLGTHARRRSFAAGIVGGLIVVGALCAFVGVVRGVLYHNVLAKAETWSAAERWGTIKDAWWSFVEYPVLGTGWGSAPTQDLVVYLLGNTGIIGLILFSVFIVEVLLRLRVAPEVRSFLPEVDVAIVIAVRVALLTLLVVNILTGFAFVFGHVWVVIGMAIACGGMLRSGGEVELSADSCDNLNPRTARTQDSPQPT